MGYTQVQIQTILTKVMTKVQHELMLAQENDTVDDLLSEYGVKLEEGALPVNPRVAKVLVIGELAGNKADYQLISKKMGIPSRNIEFVDDYSKLTNFNTSRLRYSAEYSDIICGPMPHSMSGLNGESSLLAAIKNEPDKYPRYIEAVANSSVKLSITSFKNALRETRYFEVS